jgi:hypothetical protein
MSSHEIERGEWHTIICLDCGQEKQRDEFYRCGKRLSSYCKPCDNARRTRNWRVSDARFNGRAKREIAAMKVRLG